MGVAIAARTPAPMRRQIYTMATDSIAPLPDTTGTWDYETWLRALFPNSFTAPLADYHHEFWQWVWSIEKGERVDPFVAIWPRGAGKSTNSETSCVALGARGRRSYVLYVCGSQDAADRHVESIGELLESDAIAAYYPLMGQRSLRKFGNQHGWRRNRLVTASGLTIDALGLDVASRGIKFGTQRPDYIVIDDIDTEADTTKTTQKKIDRLTRAIIPAGSRDVIVLAVQNLLTPHGLFAQLAKRRGEDGAADFLGSRIISGPHPAIEGLEVETTDGRHVIVAGRATWAGMSIEDCQAILDSDEGLSSFLIERQHEVRHRGDPLIQMSWMANNRYNPDDRMLLSEVVARVIAWDTAEEAHAKAANSAAVVGDVLVVRRNPIRYELLIREVYIGRWLQPALLAEVIEYAKLWNMDRLLELVLVEYASSGKGVIQTVRSQAPRELRNKFVPVPPRGSKDVRLGSAASQMRDGRVRLPHLTLETRAWLPGLEKEMRDAPNSERRDQTDALAHLVKYVEARYFSLEPARAS